MHLKVKRPATNEVWYDFYDDWELIEASIAQQYGIRIRAEIDTITWPEVKMLVSGLLSETPLGRIISIRSEKDRKTLKSFTPEMRKIRSDWLRKQAQDKINNPNVNVDEMFENVSKMLRAAFG